MSNNGNTSPSIVTNPVRTVYIVAAKRTPVGKAPRGAFRNMRPDDLLVHAIQAALAEVPTLDPNAIGDAIVGCAFPEGEQGMNVARMAVLLAGLPHTVAGITVNRYCASGLSAIAMAANSIACGQTEVVLAGGTESMSLVPMGGNKPAFNPRIVREQALWPLAHNMGITAEQVASQYSITRQVQDAFALLSHQKALAAQANHAFDAEIVPLTLANGQVIHHDEGPRADTTIEQLAKLKPAFSAKGSVTAGNSSQMSDGAAALVLASEAAVKQFNLTPIGRFCGFAVRGVPPEVMGIGPIEAIPAALAQCGLRLEDMAWLELNEAFAAQALAVQQSLNINPDVLNPLGGAIALGHPLGATGAIRAATLLHGLRAKNQRYGMVSMCIGTGMGAAGVIERL